MIRRSEQQYAAHQARIKGVITEVVADLKAPVKSMPKKSSAVSQKAIPENVEVTAMLPYPPTVNHYWLRNKNGGMRIGDSGIAFRDKVSQRMGWMPSFNGDVAVSIEAYPPDKRKRDLDNILKAICDAIQHAGVIANDYQIAKLFISRMPVRNGGEIFLRVKSL